MIKAQNRVMSNVNQVESQIITEEEKMEKVLFRIRVINCLCFIAIKASDGISPKYAAYSHILRLAYTADVINCLYLYLQKSMAFSVFLVIYFLVLLKE